MEQDTAFIGTTGDLGPDGPKYIATRLNNEGAPESVLPILSRSIQRDGAEVTIETFLDYNEWRTIDPIALVDDAEDEVDTIPGYGHAYFLPETMPRTREYGLEFDEFDDVNSDAAFGYIINRDDASITVWIRDSEEAPYTWNIGDPIEHREDAS